MIPIYKDLIKNYVDHLSVDQVKDLLNQYHYTYTEEELLILYKFVKDHYEDLMNQNIEVISSLKDHIHPSLYNQLFYTYLDLKQKYL